MLDNEEPWIPPEIQKTTQAPRLLPQVPELTIISTENKPNANKNNFLQRAMLTEKNLKPQTSSSVDPVKFQHVNLGNKDSRFGGEPSYKKSPLNVLKEDNRPYQHVISKPQVPDITILDDNESKRNSPSANERVFTSSYKEMMINSHNHFLKQLNSEQKANQAPNYTTKMESARFKQNPLTKYIPSPESQNYKPYKDGNSSSILTDIDITQNNNKKDDEEVTYKKVAEMLSEIQKLVIPEKSPQTHSQQNSPNSENFQQKSKNYEILKELANTYLTQEEFIKYQVESELNELEKCQL